MIGERGWYHARIRVIAYIFVLTLIAVAMVVGGFAVVQTLQKPALMTIAVVPEIELPKLEVDVARLGPVRDVIEASAESRGPTLQVATALLHVELVGALPTAPVDVVVIDDRSGAELARQPVSQATPLEFAALPRGPHGLTVVLALRNGATARRTYLQRTRVVLDGPATVFDCRLPTDVGSLTMVFPFDENPTIVELARPDDPMWHHELRGEVAVSHDGTIEVEVPAIGDGAYLVIVHDHGEHARVRPVTVRGPTRVPVSRGLR